MFGYLKSRKKKKLLVASTFTSNDVGEFFKRDLTLTDPLGFDFLFAEQSILLFFFFLLPPHFMNSKRVNNVT